MKKKLMSAIALSMAMALTFGMTAFAAPSKVTADDANTVVGAPVKAEITEVTDENLTKEADTLQKDVAVTVDGAEGTATVAPVTAGELKSAKDAVKTVADWSLKQDNKTVETTVVAAADVTFDGTIPATGITLTIAVPNLQVEAGASYIVLHLNNGQWEIVPAVVENGKITATFTSLSPIVVAKAEVKDAPAASNNNNSNNNSSTTTTTSPAESPKTGETLPVVGMLAVICLAGAAVCAKKVRYNK